MDFASEYISDLDNWEPVTNNDNDSQGYTVPEESLEEPFSPNHKQRVQTAYDITNSGEDLTGDLAEDNDANNDDEDVNNEYEDANNEDDDANNDDDDDEEIIQEKDLSQPLTIDTNVNNLENDLSNNEIKSDSSEQVQSPSFISNVLSSFRSYSQSSSNQNDNPLLSPSSSPSSIRNQLISSPNIISHRRQSSTSIKKKYGMNSASPSIPSSPQTTAITRNKRVSSISSNRSVSSSHSFKDLKPLQTISTIDSETSTESNGTEEKSEKSEKSEKPKELDYNPKKFVEETYLDTQYHYASTNRDSDFHSLFSSIPIHDRLLDDFSCALSREFLYQGRIYITETHLGFNSNILGWTSKVIIEFKSITYMEKTSSAGLFPNAISIETSEGKTQFNNFISRDGCFGLMKEVWSRNLLAQEEEERRERNGININMYHNSNHPHSLIDTYSELIQSPTTAIPYSSSDDSVIKNSTISIDESSASSSSQSKNEIDENRTDGKVFNIYRFKNTSPYKDFDYKPYLLKPTSFPLDPKVDNKEYILAEETLNCTPNQAFQLFFNNKHHNFVEAYLELMSSKNIKLPDKFETNPETGYLERHYTYEKSISGIPGGSTDCLVTDEIIFNESDKYIMVINTTGTPNVPSGNSFLTKTRYMFKWGLENRCDFSLSFWVDWIGSSWIKSMVEAGCKSGQIDATEKLLKIMHEMIDKYVTSEIVIENESAEYKLADQKIARNIENNDVKQESAVFKAESIHKHHMNENSNKNIINLLVAVIVILLLLNLRNQRSINKSIKQLQDLILASSEENLRRNL